MTWQRIDENTYIDDTLVTCAEYQLFIDEMREQGKYYQPDHWISYQFPTGQAQKPLLGIRYSDALAFCKWLAQLEASQWKFRLPNDEEASALSIKPNDINPLGYWLNGNQQFGWVQKFQDTNRADALTFALTRDDAINLVRNLSSTLDLDRISRFDHDLAFALDRNGSRDLRINFADKLDLARNRAVNVDRELACDDALDRTRKLVSILAHDQTIDIDFTHAFNLAVYIYLDLLLLKERIARRSPAFEGIRLVKERIR